MSEAVLKGLGIETCGELFRKRAIIRLLFSDCSFQWFLRVSLGISGVGGGNVKETRVFVFGLKNEYFYLFSPLTYNTL